jgi:type IV secretory pathway TrbD component
LALGRLAPFPATYDPFHQHALLGEGLMADKTQKHRTNRVFKSLHKPLTYLGVERTLFYFVCVGAVGAFNLFNSILAGIAVFIGGFAFGHWVTNSDPAFLRILARSERYKLRYDAAKQAIPRVEVL